MAGTFRQIYHAPRWALSIGSLWAVSAAAQIYETFDYLPVREDQIETAFRRLRRNDSLQFELPEPPPAAETPGWLVAIGEFIAALFRFLAPILEVLFWLGLGALIFGALYLIAKTIYDARQAGLGRKTKAASDAPPPLYQPEERQARILLEEIDALAAQGRFEEAVHTLLFRSIQDIDLNRPNVIRRSLTSREIGTLSILTEKAQGAFATIAQIVEQSFFGGQTLGRAEFDRAREAYSALALGPSADQKAAA